jgi:SMODS and SLOG-associating 2TM effector domain 1
LDTPGVTPALIAAIGAWVEMNQHDALASSYASSAMELASWAPRLQLVSSEAEWRLAVATCERALTNEMTSWGGVHHRVARPVMQEPAVAGGEARGGA